LYDEYMTYDLPSGFRSDFIKLNSIKLHVVHNGAPYDGKPFEDERQAILLLHGFPEF